MTYTVIGVKLDKKYTLRVNHCLRTGFTYTENPSDFAPSLLPKIKALKSQQKIYLKHL